MLFAPSLAGPWTNVYTGLGITIGTNAIRDFPINSSRGFYRFWK